MLNEIQFAHHITRSGMHQVTARHQGTVVGGLQWFGHAVDPGDGAVPGEIDTVATLPEYQGRGIASGMLNHAKGMAGTDTSVAYPQPSSRRTDAGSGWMSKAMGAVPENTEPMKAFSENSTRSLVSAMARS